MTLAAALYIYGIMVLFPLGMLVLYILICLLIP